MYHKIIHNNLFCDKLFEPSTQIKLTCTWIGWRIHEDISSSSSQMLVNMRKTTKTQWRSNLYYSSEQLNTVISSTTTRQTSANHINQYLQ